MASVIFKTGTKAEYDALQQKEDNVLYFLTDQGHEMIMKGTKDMSEQFSLTSSPLGEGYMRLVRKLNGAVYDLPLGATVSNLLDDGLALRYSEKYVSNNDDLLNSIAAVTNVPASGDVKAGTVFRVKTVSGGNVSFNPGQFSSHGDALYAKDGDLIIALYKIKLGNVQYTAEDGESWKSNHQAFAVIPTDLINLVTADDTLDNDKVVLGAGNRGIKALDFPANGAGKILAINQSGNGVEWLSPETVQSDLVWESIQ